MTIDEKVVGHRVMNLGKDHGQEILDKSTVLNVASVLPDTCICSLVLESQLPHKTVNLAS